MIYTDIKRKCGHTEQIGIAGFSGSLRDIEAEYQTAVYNNIKSAENKLCMPCFMNLSTEERLELMKEVKDG